MEVGQLSLNIENQTDTQNQNTPHPRQIATHQLCTKQGYCAMPHTSEIAANYEIIIRLVNEKLFLKRGFFGDFFALDFVFLSIINTPYRIIQFL